MGINRSGLFTLPAAVNRLTAAVALARHGSGHDLPWPYGRGGRVCLLQKRKTLATVILSAVVKGVKCV